MNEFVLKFPCGHQLARAVEQLCNVSEKKYGLPDAIQFGSLGCEIAIVKHVVYKGARES